jgi:hypothetical protein
MTMPGKPLSTDLRAKMERAFGEDFNDVRVHESTQANTLGASAYAQGNTIHVAPGKATDGLVIAHELVHVVQQRHGRIKTTINDDAALEHEANSLADRAARGEPVKVR